jgi:hypothetical protein
VNLSTLSRPKAALMLISFGTFHSGSALRAQDEGFLLRDLRGPLQSAHALSTMALPTGQAQAGNEVSQLPVGSSQPPDEPASAARLHPTGGPPGLSPLSQPLSPTNAGDKAKTLLEPAFGPRGFFTPGLIAGIRMAKTHSRYPHEWRSGGEGYAHIYSDAYAQNAASAFTRFSVAVILHEDPRYRRAESTSVGGRLRHALTFSFVDRTDAGHRTVAFSNFAGATARGLVGNAYLPEGYNDATHAEQRMITGFAGIVGQNLLQEFSPELARTLKALHVPHIPLPPVWWTKNK